MQPRRMRPLVATLLSEELVRPIALERPTGRSKCVAPTRRPNALRSCCGSVRDGSYPLVNCRPIQVNLDFRSGPASVLSLPYLRQREYPQPPPPSTNNTRTTINRVSMPHHLHHCYGLDFLVWFSPSTLR